MSHRQRDQVFLEFSRWGYDQMGWRPNTRKNYYGRVLRAERWLQEHRGTSVMWASPQDLKAYLWSTKPEARTRNSVRAALIGFGKFLEAQGYTEVNHALSLARLPDPRDLPKDIGREAALRVASIAAAQPLCERVCFFTFIYSGMRLEEVRTLRWALVDLDQGWFRFTQKGGSEREHVIHPELRPMLRQWRQECPSPEWVFPSPQKQGSPYSQRWMQRMIQMLGEAAGLPVRLHPHALRHTCATLLLEANVNLRTVQKYMGHASIQTTVRYLGVRPGLLQDAAGAFSLRNAAKTDDDAEDKGL